MGFSAGTLDLSILGVSDSAVASIDKTVKSLNSLSRAVNKINNSNFYSAGVHLEAIFMRIGRATNSINSTNLDNLASAAKSLSAISKIGNLGKVDFEKVSAGFAKLSVSIQPFLDKVKGAETSLVALNGVLSKSSKTQITNALNGDGKSKGKSSLWSAVQWTTVLYTARRLGSVVANIVQKGSDFGETLNLWQVSMGNELLPQATEFVNKLNEAYGISKKTLMNSQAIFKNMLGSLGQISDQSAYALSEGITQMALDYASLYNVKFEDAMTKFQAALAGQVRPIRSVAGYDITENTLFQLYEQLGGTKTMRQLSRTEKQLLAIYAVFQQMDRSGATGDLKETLSSYANQSRIFADAMNDIGTYAGVIVTRLVESKGIFKYINGTLLFFVDLLEAVANTLPSISQGGDPMAGITEGAENASQAIDEVNGKLLDFDKFRSLSSQESADSSLNLDQKLIDAVAGYSTILDQVDNASREFADNLKKASGLFNEEGVFDVDKWNEIKDALLNIGEAILIVFSVSTIKGIVEFIKKIDLAAVSVGLLETALSGGILYAFVQAIQAFKDGDYYAGILSTTIGVALVGAFILLKRGVLIDGVMQLDLFGKTLNGTTLIAIASIALLTAGIMSLIGAWDDMSGWHKALTIIGAVTAAIIGAVVAIKALSLSVPVALALGAALAGGVMLISSQFKTQDIPMHANGASDIDGGTLFVAGEMGKTEAVYTGGNGKTNVANIQQMKAAYSQALTEWWAKAKYDVPSLEGVSDSGLYTIVDGEAKRRGKRFANV